jgi:AhpD family alkylhydroperoxidase
LRLGPAALRSSLANGAGAEAEVIPHYLRQHYWGAYIHPLGVRLFERQWLVNFILWGKFARLRDAAREECGLQIKSRTLQIASVCGDFTTLYGPSSQAESWFSSITNGRGHGIPFAISFRQFSACSSPMPWTYGVTT